MVLCPKARNAGYIRGVTAICLASVFVRAVPNTTLCGQYENVTDSSNTYRLSTNVWGLDDSGSSCVGVADNATVLTTTWSWLENDTLVHAYPNINFNPIQHDPIQISSLASIDVKVAWSMRPTISKSVSAYDAKGLAAINAKSNVAFDVFFDPDIKNAVNTTAPRYEVMVWLGKFGSIDPIGADHNGDASKLPVQKIGKQKFTLYQGSNDNGQYVFSWVANSNRTEFEGDISPLIHYLWRKGLILASNYIGVIQFGTEQKHATSNVTFAAYEYSMSATRGMPKEATASTGRIPVMAVVYTVAIAIVVSTICAAAV